VTACPDCGQQFASRFEFALHDCPGPQPNFMERVRQRIMADMDAQMSDVIPETLERPDLPPLTEGSAARLKLMLWSLTGADIAS
jgi:hypothetical protein